MSALLLLLAVARQGSVQVSAKAHVPRFERQAPLPTIPGVMIDTFTTGIGLASETARGEHLQARILWIDATANIDRYNTDDKIVGLVRQIRDAGFNTIVFDVKPISGQVVYPSKLAPKLTNWRGASLPVDFDPLAIMLREAKRNGLFLYASLNAFSEGHRLFNVGPGYEKTAQQTVLYETNSVVRDAFGSAFPLFSTADHLVSDSVCLFTSQDRLPGPLPEGFAVSLDRNGLVVDGFEQGGAGKAPPIPKGGSVLFGVAAAAEWLRHAATPGAKISFDTDPVYTPMGKSLESQIPLMMNPNDSDERRYILEIARELVGNYAIDGFLFDDRFRYAGLNADFSPITRALFEGHVGHPISWPDDVFKFTLTKTLGRGVQPGAYYDAWMAWRTSRLQEFIQEVRHEARIVRATIQVGLYVGSWYGDYPALGNNYAAPGVEAGFWFLTPAYRQTGLASSVDFLITGCYYPTATIFEAMGKGVGIGATIEAASSLTNRLVRDQTWTYAGLSLEDYRDNPEGLQNALQAACASAQGVMVFDLSHNIEPMWPVFTRSFQQPRVPPHAHPEALALIRRRRAALDKIGVKTPAISISAGSAGTGQ